MPVLIDFESRSRVDLSEIGGRLYWEHPSSEALCCVWYDTRSGTAGCWYPGQQWPHEGRVLAAHNAAGFDRFAAERYRFGAAGWIDTSQLARKAGLPGALDALGTRWCDVPKDAEGSRFTKALSSVRRPPKSHARYIPTADWATLSDEQKRERGFVPDITPEVLARVVQYCVSDVAILAQTWPRLQRWIACDQEVEALDRVINDRGICFDRDLARRLLEEDARVAREALVLAAVEIGNGVTVDEVRGAASSPAQFCAITGASNAQAETVEAMTHPLARARLALASIARGKLEAGFALTSPDGRMRDTLLYYGAHTGRWSGKGMQLQNLPRPAKHFEDLPADTCVPHTIVDGKRVVDVDRYAGAVLRGALCDADSIALLVRATLTASPGHALVVCDFSSVEARATAWLAGDNDALAVFRSGRDPYKVAAAKVFGVDYDAVSKTQRQVGKVCELALGYQGGPNALQKMAHVYRCDLSALDLRAVVDAWRSLHEPIRSLWYACEHAFRAALRGDRRWVGPLEFVGSDSGDAVACFLPSGRPIVYQEPREDGTSRTGLIYRSPSKTEAGVINYCPQCWIPMHDGACAQHGAVDAVQCRSLYGGKLVENAIQGLCRDLMASAMLRAEAAGLRIVLTVHDEIVCDVPDSQAAEAYETLRACMLELPPWAAGFPIDASGWVGFRYRK